MQVRELTGDINLTKREIEQTQVRIISQFPSNYQRFLSKAQNIILFIKVQRLNRNTGNCLP